MAKLFSRFLPVLSLTLSWALASVSFAGEPIVFSGTHRRSQPAPAQLANARVETALERLPTLRPFETVIEPPPTTSSSRSPNRRGTSRKDKEKAEAKQDWMGLDKDELRDRAEDDSFLELEDGDLDEREAPSEAAEAAESRRPGRNPQQVETAENRIPAHILSPTQREAREKKTAAREARTPEQLSKESKDRQRPTEELASLPELDLKKLAAPNDLDVASPDKPGALSLRDFLGAGRPAATEPDVRGPGSFNAFLNQTLRGSTLPAGGGPGEIPSGFRTSDPLFSRPSVPEANPLRPDPNDSSLSSPQASPRSSILPEMPKLIPQKPNERELRGTGSRPGEDSRRQFDVRELREFERDTFRKARGLQR